MQYDRSTSSLHGTGGPSGQLVRSKNDALNESKVQTLAATTDTQWSRHKRHKSRPLQATALPIWKANFWHISSSKIVDDKSVSLSISNKVPFFLPLWTWGCQLVEFHVLLDEFHLTEAKRQNLKGKAKTDLVTSYGRHLVSKNGGLKFKSRTLMEGFGVYKYPSKTIKEGYLQNLT